MTLFRNRLSWIPVALTSLVSMRSPLVLFCSTTHRVTNPPRERASKARYSLPFFLHFNPDFLIKTLPQYVDATHPDEFPVPINAHDFLQERLREIKLI